MKIGMKEILTEILIPNIKQPYMVSMTYYSDNYIQLNKVTANLYIIARDLIDDVLDACGKEVESTPPIDMYRIVVGNTLRQNRPRFYRHSLQYFKRTEAQCLATQTAVFVKDHYINLQNYNIISLSFR